MRETVEDQAGYIYYSCDEIVASPNGARWDVFDGDDTIPIDTVDSEVLQYLDDNYDLPVQTVGPAEWRAVAH